MAITRREYADILNFHSCSIPDGDKEIDKDFILFIESCRRIFDDFHREQKLHLSSAYGKLEPLTDSEQRIFLTAMFKEEKICETVDKAVVREAYEDTLVWMCHEIKRKVKKALWT